MHHVPHTGDLPNTVTTVSPLYLPLPLPIEPCAYLPTLQTARSIMAIVPQNYLLSDASRQTIQQVRVNLASNGSVAMPTFFGAKQPTCSVELAGALPDLGMYSGEVLVPKYPYDPHAVGVFQPGGGLAVDSRAGGSGLVRQCPPRCPINSRYSMLRKAKLSMVNVLVIPSSQNSAQLPESISLYEGAFFKVP